MARLHITTDFEDFLHHEAISGEELDRRMGRLSRRAEVEERKGDYRQGWQDAIAWVQKKALDGSIP